MKRPVVLCIMDGFGYNPSEYGNAIKAANTPRLDALMAEYPMTYIGASGMDVGLPDGQMGNSEVGHTNIGAGRVVYQELTRITKSIQDGDFFEKEAFVKAIENCKKNNSAFHLIGLVSDGGVHSHNTHLYGLLELAKKNGLDKVYVHALLDGRDVPPASGVEYLEELEAKMKEIGVGKIATVMGRFYAMDRDNIWDRVGKAYNAMVNGEGIHSDSAVEAVKKSYETIDEDGKYLTDEFVMPTVINNTDSIKADDSVIFFNFRPDRAREITRTFVDPDFNGFERTYFPLYYVCMTQYDATMPNVDVAFKPEALTNTMGEIISRNGLKQLRIAETQKYAHVTFFYNGGEEKVYEGEDRVLIDSPKISTFDLKPEMSAYEVCDEACARIRSGKYDMVILNYANCDMVGHTGIFDAAVKAVETVDECVGKLYDAVMDMDGVILITADHGNADKMYEDDGSPFTAHTTNPVPLIVAGYGNDFRLKAEGGRLCDLSPTMLEIMGIEKPAEMTGVSLIER
ncbi:MAG: 2,3-bisphosphoglycerate-independent phosphoglycerate mutase [Clostridiaceae bacterium]|nr:2,3-bisphosphoglycerate-independent phosphoglycerate mutase [Clostridiaceae bacterium]